MAKKFTLSDLKKLEKKGLKVNGTEGYVPSEPTGLIHIKNILSQNKVKFVVEYMFHPTRKWRFDIFLIEHNIGIEYEGIFSKVSRHTTYQGYNEDCNKYNAAATLGIFVFRYTSSNYLDFASDLTKKGLIN